MSAYFLLVSLRVSAKMVSRSSSFPSRKVFRFVTALSFATDLMLSKRPMANLSDTENRVFLKDKLPSFKTLLKYFDRQLTRPVTSRLRKIWHYSGNLNTEHYELLKDLFSNGKKFSFQMVL